MGVQTIIKLKVPDRLVNPHDEKTMAKAVKDFKVEIFDWKVLDLSLSVFDPDAKEKIKELHLYSSGKRSAISHWFGPEGFKSMKKVRKPHPLSTNSGTNTQAIARGPQDLYCSSRTSLSSM